MHNTYKRLNTDFSPADLPWSLLQKSQQIICPVSISFCTESEANRGVSGVCYTIQCSIHYMTSMSFNIKARKRILNNQNLIKPTINLKNPKKEGCWPG